MESDQRILVTVIGGYLGAGKTTLVNHVLRTADERVAVLVNDFGDINIDADLIERQDGDTIALANGCICCSLVDGLASALNTIAELERRPERLVIEASGVADPASVAAYGHGPGFALDAVVVVTDAETIQNKAVDKYVGDTVIGQLRSADIVILNKTDLVDDDDVGSVREWITTTAQDAIVIDAVQAKVGHEVLFGQVAKPGVNAESAHGTHQHDQRFDAWTWRSDQPIPRQRLEAMMDALPDSVVRVKGLIVVEDRPDEVMLLQRVGKRWSLVPNGPLPVDGSSRLVFIGLIGAIDEHWINRLDSP